MRPAILASPERRSDRAQDDSAPPLWNRMAVTTAALGPAGPVPAPATLRRALRVLDPAIGGPASGTRATPSAGAIYPFEYFLLLTGETGGTEAWRLDPPTRRMILVHAGPESAGDLLAETLWGTVPAHGAAHDGVGDRAVAVLVSRPWLSMRKYGDRGYLYTQLDSAHAAAGIGLAARALGAEFRIRHRPDAAALARALGGTPECRQIHSTVAFTLPAEFPGTADPPAGRPAWQAWDGRRSESVAAAQWLERSSWESLGLSQLPATPWPGGPEAGPLDADAARPARIAQVFAKDLARRRSASGFEPGSLSAGQIRVVLDYAGAALPTDLPHGSSLAVRMLLKPGSGPALDEGALPGVDVRGLELTRPQVAAAFMAQEHLGEAACVLLLHAEKAALIDDERVLHEATFRAGLLGQLVYLGATVAGVGVTGVGGFDSAAWCRAAGLPGDREVVYVLALGRESGGGKLDRAEPAYAQNER